MTQPTIQAVLVSNNGTDGFLFLVNLTTQEVTNTITMAGASGASRVGVDSQNGYAIVVDTTNNVAYSIRLSDGNTINTDIPSSVDVAVHSLGARAVITHVSNVLASLIQIENQTVDDTTTATGDEGETSVSATFVDTDQNETN